MGIMFLVICIGFLMTIIENEEFIEKRLGQPWIRKTWHYIKVSTYCLFGVYLLGSVTSEFVIDKFFPNQKPGILSGSPAVIFSFLFWGSLGLWIATGRERELGEKDPDLSTSVGRINWLFEKPLNGAVILCQWLYKPVLWLIVGIAIFVVIQLGISLSERSLASMSTSKAIVLAGVIIAAAILAVGRKR